MMFLTSSADIKLKFGFFLNLFFRKKFRLSVLTYLFVLGCPKYNLTIFGKFRPVYVRQTFYNKCTSKTNVPNFVKLDIFSCSLSYIKPVNFWWTSVNSVCYYAFPRFFGIFSFYYIESHKINVYVTHWEGYFVIFSTIFEIVRSRFLLGGITNYQYLKHILIDTMFLSFLS